MEVHVDILALIGIEFFHSEFGSQKDLTCEAVEAVYSSREAGIMNHGTFSDLGTGFQVDAGTRMVDSDFDVKPGCSALEWWPGADYDWTLGCSGRGHFDELSNDDQGTNERRCTFYYQDNMIDDCVLAPGTKCVGFWWLHGFAPMPEPMLASSPAPVPAPVPAPIPTPTQRTELVNLLLHRPLPRGTCPCRMNLEPV